MRRLVLLLLALGLTFAAPASAFAHDVLEKTSPADGTTVDRLPESVMLTFVEPPVAIGTQVLVKGPTGDVTSGAPTINGSEVVQRIAPGSPAGDYTVTYRVTSNDGHPVTGSIGFHATVGLDGSTATAGPTVHVPPDDAAATAAEDSQFVPVVLTIAGTVVLLGIVGFLVLRARAHRD